MFYYYLYIYFLFIVYKYFCENFNFIKYIIMILILQIINSHNPDLRKLIVRD